MVYLDLFQTVLGKLGPCVFCRQIGPGRLGPTSFLAANWPQNISNTNIQIQLTYVPIVRLKSTALLCLWLWCSALQCYLQHLRNLDHLGSATFSLTPPVRAPALVPSSMSTPGASAVTIGKFSILSLVHLRSLSFDCNVMFWQFDLYVFSGSVSLLWLENPEGLFQGINIDWLIADQISPFTITVTSHLAVNYKPAAVPVLCRDVS